MSTSIFLLNLEAFLPPLRVTLTHQSLSFFERALRLTTLCDLSRLRCNGNSTLLGTYLHRVGRAATPSCTNCGSESQDIFHIVQDIFHIVTVVLNHRIFSYRDLHLNLYVWPSLPTPSLFWTSGLVLGGFFNYWDSSELILAPIFRNGWGKPTTTTTT